jgi:1,2-phenylacetyl-CoA epoxidase catalytic subunit
MVDSAHGASDASPPRGAVVELLGLLAYAELVSFFQLSADARLAPTLADKAALAGLAAREHGHFEQLRARLSELGADADTAMAPFTDAVDSWHALSQPQTWLESLVKAYIGEGIAGDFYRRVAENADQQTRELVDGVLHESERAEFVAAKVREALAEDPSCAGRLALWARRLVGDALSQAQRVAVAHPALATLVTGRSPGSVDTEEVGRSLAELTDSHSRRLKHLGLTT